MEWELGASTAAKEPRQMGFNWLSPSYALDLTPFQQFILTTDYSKSLGPISRWPVQLQNIVLMVVADPTPAVVYWGNENYIVYNEAYTQLIGQKHPALQGQDPKIEFAEIWDYFEQLLAEQRETGRTKVEANQLLLLQRHGYLEETYFSWKFVPMISKNGEVVASYATVVETTKEVVSERRLSAIRSLSREVASAKNTKSLWAQVLQGLEYADKDVPLALLYSVVQDAGSPQSDAHEMIISCNLEGSVGVGRGHNIMIPENFVLSNSDCWLAAPFREASIVFHPVLLDAKSGTFQEIQDVTWRGFGVPSTQMVVCPIYSTYTNTVLAFVVVGLSPRRTFDEEHQNFIHLLTQQISIPLIVLHEESVRCRYAAEEQAIAQAKLSRELTHRTLEYEASEVKFERFASRAQMVS